MEPLDRIKRVKTDHVQENNSSNEPLPMSPLEEFTECFTHDLFSSSKFDDIKDKYEISKPFKYCEISPIFENKLLKDVQTEIIDNLNFTLKETDIYAYNQSGDLANLDGLPADEKNKLPSLKLLRDAIYSPQFRSFVSKITGCGPLSGIKTDMSTNIFKDTNYLLLHDDVIEDRIISFIIYLPTLNGKKDWEPAEGGALELYPVIDNSSVPHISPETSLSTRWNKIVFFEVKPGYSFHSVSEVIAKDPKVQRLSIQGWFHAPQKSEVGYSSIPKTLSHTPTLKQIHMGDDYLSFTKIETPQNASHNLVLSNDDKAYLEIFVNPDYLSDKIIQQTQNLFLEQSYIQLGKFLNFDNSAKLEEIIKVADKLDNFNTTNLPYHGSGECGRWKVRGPSVLRRFLELDGPSGSNTADKGINDHQLLTFTLASLRDELFKSEAFRNWISIVTQVDIGSYRGSVRRFRPGLDYVLASKTGITNPTIDVNLSLTPIDSTEDKNLWQSGQVGGYECYLTVEPDDTPASVYKRLDDEDPLLTVPASWNTLNLVYCEPEVLKFTHL
ncbi:hypothetical protein BB561_002123 [Smittium simulii]|uniref:Fe2OG dioxygenase domain-containing protein n=1 Tax=Smittium simulii TaxID=133385 RepID=A0A2T9YRL9_9FUNG|nr:hypothetical protein BB561_002123 [Smittium simulii]